MPRGEVDRRRRAEVIGQPGLRLPGTPAWTLARERVSRALESLGDAPLVVLCAPAGSGKTVALANWLGGDGEFDGNGRDGRGDRRTVWVSLDANHDDPRRLARRLAQALDEGAPGSMDAAVRRMNAGADLLDVCLPAVIDGLRRSAPARTVIALDDYHVLADPGCHAFVDGLLAAGLD